MNTTNRTDVLAYYSCVYNASQNYPADMGWTGNVANGVPGTTTATFMNDVLRRINFYRGLVGLPANITFNATDSTGDQAAALMFSANNAISHTPPTSWIDYTSTGAQAAGNSNIALGTYGPGSIDAYMQDNGNGNNIAGHRRWLLYSQAAVMGTGDVPPNGSNNSANAVWVIGNFGTAPPPQFVPWPNSGFTPVGLVPANWSLSYPGANFGSATVTMKQGSTTVPTTIISNVDNGYGDNTLVWTPTGIPTSVSADTPYSVTVSGISGSGVPTSYTYTVTLFDPTVLGQSVTIAGSSTPPVTGGTYTFNSITEADSYRLQVSTASAVTWDEGAEDATASLISSATTGSYTLRQTAVVHSGAKAFQLAFPDFNDQSFTLLRNIIPSATSQLQFYDLGRFATTTTTFSAEISTNNGGSWTPVFTRNGVGLSSANWDPSWNSRSISLASYSGQIIQIRFILQWNNNSIVIDTSSNSGFFVDDITVTNGLQLVNPTTTTLAGAATSFNLNASTAGASLVPGQTYYLQVQPSVGTLWFPFGPYLAATVQTPSVTSSMASLAENASSFVITGSGFDPVAGNNTVTFNDGAVGTVTAATANSLTVAFSHDPTSLGALTVVVTTDGVSSGSAVQVATVSTPVPTGVRMIGSTSYRKAGR